MATLNRREWLARSSASLGALLLTGPAGLANAFPDPLAAASAAPFRLHYNENPYGPSEAARRAMIEAFSEANLYTREAAQALRNLIAEQENISPDYVMLGSGSGEILNAAGLVFGIHNGEIVTAYPSFEGLTFYAERVGATVHRVPLTEDMQYNLGAMQQRLTNAMRLVYICNPNNPTGTLIPTDDLRSFCVDTAQRAVVFVDEAYREYVDAPDFKSMIDLVRDGHNVIVSRTASKIHALAGLRVGFGFAHPDLIKQMQNHVTGSLNVVGLRGALASYGDVTFQAQSHQQNNDAKNRLYTLLDNKGCTYLPTQTNFVFFRTGQPIREFRDAMEERGVLVARPFPPYTDWCRVSLGTPDAMDAFATALNAVL
ncbi:MAG TPA: aminotransferase class I/II-fold pyridoxal phosphate-dependent enzyme [Rhodothermales bacterium]|nr:aminotransferase class I/II-fold pyridoxal phosphate-dependent enzyme [Rhodothermales bacterium]